MAPERGGFGSRAGTGRAHVPAGTMPGRMLTAAAGLALVWSLAVAPVPVAVEAVADHLPLVLQAHAVHRLVQRARQNNPPEPLDGTAVLAVRFEPRQQRRVGVCTRPEHCGQPVGDAELVAGREVVRPEQRAAEVERGRPRVRLEHARAAVRRDEVQLRLRREQVSDADHAQEVREVGAAPHADVLARVHHLPGGGVGERAGPAAEPRPRLQHRDAEPAARQAYGRSEARKAAADHNDARPSVATAQSGGQSTPHFTSQPEAYTAALRHFGTRTRPVNTSYPRRSISSSSRPYAPHMM